MKNPCLHPRGYKRFTAVYVEYLDKLFDGECLLFSTHPSCKTSPVFEMSGADLDGDDFLVVTQQDLLPRPDINDIIRAQNFDEQGEQILPAYIDDFTIVDYFLEYALHENTAELSQLHEAFSEWNEEGIGHKDCLTIAKYHSYALDFPKTGKAAIFPKDAGIPMAKEINKLYHCIYPHYMSSKPSQQKFRSTMVKGEFYDFILSKLPEDLAKDRTFRRDAMLEHEMPNDAKPFLRNNNEQKYKDEQNYHHMNNHINLNHYNGANNHKYNNNNNNIRFRPSDNERMNRFRHQMNGIIEDPKNKFNNNSNNRIGDTDDNEEDFEKKMEVFNNPSFEKLNQMIESPEARQFLKDGSKLSEAEIKELRAQLGLKQQEHRPPSIPSWELFHVDMYYETMLNHIRSHNDQNRIYKDDQSESESESESDNYNENEEEKRSSD